MEKINIMELVNNRFPKLGEKIEKVESRIERNKGDNSPEFHEMLAIREQLVECAAMLVEENPEKVDLASQSNVTDYILVNQTFYSIYRKSCNPKHLVVVLAGCAS